jgi:hypothetical protein
MRLGHTTEFRFLLAIGDHPVDVAMPGTGLPTFCLAGIEPYMIGRSGGIERIEQDFHGPVVFKMLRDPSRDASSSSGSGCFSR